MSAADGSPNPAAATAADAVAASTLPGEMMHVASYTMPEKPAARQPAAAKPVTDKAQKPAPATKPAKSAMADPLAPLPGAKAAAKGSAPAQTTGGTSTKTPKARVTD